MAFFGSAWHVRSSCRFSLVRWCVSSLLVKLVVAGGAGISAVSYTVVKLNLLVDNEGDAVAGKVNVCEVVARQNDRAAGSHVGPHGSCDGSNIGGVKRAHGLVEKEQVCSCCHGGGNGGELRHSLRTLSDGKIEESLNAKAGG